LSLISIYKESAAAGIEQGFLAWLAPMDVMKKVASRLGVEIDHILPFGYRNNYLIIFDDVFVKRKQKPLACGLHRNGFSLYRICDRAAETSG